MLGPGPDQDGLAIMLVERKEPDLTDDCQCVIS